MYPFMLYLFLFRFVFLLCYENNVVPVEILYTILTVIEKCYIVEYHFVSFLLKKKLYPLNTTGSGWWFSII